MNICHFDCDSFIFPLLKERKSTLELTPKTVRKIKGVGELEIVTVKTQSYINSAVLSKMTHLKLVITRTVGVDHIDLEACKEKNIAVYHIPSYGPKSVAQHTIALLLSGAREIVKANDQTHKGRFSHKKFMGLSMEGKTLGILGTGRIGLEVVKIAKVLGMHILAFDISKNDNAAKELGFKYVELDKLLKNCDVLTLHLPATAATRHIIDDSAIKKLKNGVILVNTGRGDLIDTKALIKHIKKFYAIALDVIEKEDKFNKRHPLLKFNNVVITPHCAFFTDQSLKVIVQETQANINRFKSGDKTNRVI